MPSRAVKGQASGAPRRRRGNCDSGSLAAPPPHVRAFSYYGGKSRHLPFIFHCLPESASFHFVDVFGGSGAVALNMVPHYPMVTFNDVDSRVVNFFRTLREQPDELIRAIDLTPYAREEFQQASKEEPAESDGVDAARRFFVRVSMSFGAKPKHSGMRLAKSTAVGLPPSRTFAKRGNMLWDVVERLKDMQIENSDASDIIRGYDLPTTLFYIDPPYLPSTRASRNDYKHDMDERDHIDLCELLRSSDAHVMVSGYRSELYDELYHGWERIDDSVRVLHHSVARNPEAVRQESIWRNYSVKLPLLAAIGEST